MSCYPSDMIRRDPPNENNGNTGAARELLSIRHALDQSAIVAITDVAGKIVHVNDKFCEISKYSRDELLGQNHRVVNSGHHPHEFFVQMWKTISSGRIWEGEIKNRAKDGSYYWVHTTIVPMLNDKGLPYEYVAIRHEVTQRKLAEEAIKEREKSFRAILDATYEGILLSNDGIVLETNAAVGTIFGYSQDEMLGMRVEQLVHDDHRDIVREHVTREDEVRYEITGLKKDGTEIHLEVSGKTMVYKGERVRLKAIHDVTQKREMQSKILLQDRLASIGMLASGLAHEIGTPLGVIRGRAEYIAMQSGSNESLKKNADIITSQIDRVSKLIRALLNLARGGDSTSPQALDLRQSVSDILELMGHEFTKRHARIEGIAGESKPRVVAEAEALHQVLLNLLVNASHAIDSAIAAGRTSNHCLRFEVKDLGSHWGLRITDSGCGISEGNLKNLFKPFFTTKDVGSGTGLGLATSYQLVQAWGGSIEVESREGVGSTFEIRLKKA